MYSRLGSPQIRRSVMGKFVDRAGQRFGRLIVLERAGTDALKKVVWKCRCDCGNETHVTSGSLTTGNTVSCGCYLKERITKHGGWKKSSYNTWRAMIRRCTVLTDKDYKRYGAVGIGVCAEWADYKKFAEDMGEPEGNETLDRINPYAGYTKDNCRWSTPTVQARNIRVKKINKSGVTGVHLRGKKWYAEITARKQKYYSHACETLEEAAAARKELERIYWAVT